VFGEGAVLDGGAGDDVIVARGGVATVTGGDGDDLLEGVIFNTDTVRFDGGTGNDTINAVQLENGTVSGGAGDDRIEMGSYGSGGAGYALSVDGGSGADVIAFDNTFADYFVPDAQSHLAGGGTGADTFELRLSEGNVQGASDPAAPVRLDTLTLSDFESGVDAVEIDATPLSSGFTLTTAELEQSAGAAGTETSLILRFESADPAIGDREIAVSFGAAAVSFDDITFTGAVTPVVVAPVT